jgi:RNA recognition motif-containing protein
MTVSNLVNTESPDQGRPDEYAEIEFKTQADANAAVTQLNAISKRQPGSHSSSSSRTPRKPPERDFWLQGY